MSTKKLQLLENIFPANGQAGQVLSIDTDGNKTWVDMPTTVGVATEEYVDNAVAGVNAVPRTTVDDNGKILTVVDGIPTWDFNNSGCNITSSDDGNGNVTLALSVGLSASDDGAGNVIIM